MSGVKQQIKEFYDNGPQNLRWLYDHAIEMTDLSFNYVLQYSGDYNLAAQTSLAGLLADVGITQDPDNPFDASLQILDSLVNERNEPQFGYVTRRILLDYWKGLEGQQPEKREGYVLFSADLNTRFRDDYFLKAHGTFHFEDYMEYSIWVFENVQFADRMCLKDFKPSPSDVKKMTQLLERSNNFKKFERDYKKLKFDKRHPFK